LKRYIPERGDLIWLDFDPSSGKEIMKRRPAFVISRKQFNTHLGLAIVAPITSQNRTFRCLTDRTSG
jgi:mRNA interferase MazF/mRNA interferase ChpB